MDRITSFVLLNIVLLCSAIAEPENKQVDESSHNYTESSTLMAEDRELWCDEMKSKLKMRKASKDPFGLAKNYVKKVAAPKKVEQQNEVVNRDFENTIQNLEIGVINAAKREFLLNSKTYQAGSIFNMKSLSLGIDFKVKVISVNSSGIIFEDMNSGKTSNKPIGGRPAGFSSGSGIKKVDGIRSSGEGGSVTVE